MSDKTKLEFDGREVWFKHKDVLLEKQYQLFCELRALRYIHPDTTFEEFKKMEADRKKDEA